MQCCREAQTNDAEHECGTSQKEPPVEKNDLPETNTNPDSGLLARQVARHAAGTALPAIVGLASAVLYARLFGADGYGAYAVALAIMTTVTLLATQWIVQGILRYRPGAVGQRGRGIQSAAFRLAWLSAVVGICSGGILYLIVLRSPQQVLLAAIAPITAYLALSCFTSTAVAVLHSDLRAGRVAAYRIAESLLRLSAGLVIYYSTHRPLPVLWAAALAAAMLLPFAIRDTWPRRTSAPDDPVEIRRLSADLARYGVPMTGWFLAVALLDVGDRFVLMHYRGAAEVGRYAANYALAAGVIALCTTPLLLTLHPIIMRRFDAGDEREATRLIHLGVRFVAATGTVLTIFLVVASRTIARGFLGADFVASAPLMGVIAPGLCLWQIAAYIHKPLEMRGRTSLLLLAAVAAAALNLVLCVVWVPAHGAAGAAWATLVAYGGYLGLMIAGSRSVTRRP